MQLSPSIKKKLIDAWPSIYRFIDGFASYLFTQGRKITIDIINELLGRS